MAKKTGAPVGEFVKAGLSTLSDVVVTNIFSRIHDEADVLLEKLEQRAYQVQRRLARRVGTSLLFGAAATLLLLAAFFALREYLGWTRTLSFLAMGVLTLLIALALRYQEGR